MGARASEAEKAKVAAEQSIKEARAQLVEAQKAKTASELSFADVNMQLGLTRKAKVAAELSFKQIKEQLDTLESARKASEGQLKTYFVIWELGCQAFAGVRRTIATLPLRRISLPFEVFLCLHRSGIAFLFGLFGGGYSAESVLEAYQLRANINGHPVDANSIDWNSIDIRSVSFQQPPGPKNPLGDVKFMFPNKHDVYMHDTPERNLFVNSFRALSHGCMRVEHPRRLASILLAEDKGWSEAKVGSLFNGDSVEVQLTTHIPVHVTYFTAMVDYEGKLRTFGDLYGLDDRVGAALFGRKVRFETPRYDDEPVASRQQDMRGQVRQQQSSGPSTLAEAISDIFSP